MASLNSNDGKIPVKNFNDFFENDQQSRAFSKLKLRKLKNDLTPLTVANPIGPKMILSQMAKPSVTICKYYKYNREELLEISKCPLSRISKKDFLSRLKNPSLDEEIILSFQKKERSPNNDDMSDHSQNFVDNHHGNRVNKTVQNNGPNSQENLNNPFNQKFHRFGKNYNEADTYQSWRNATDRYSPNFRVGKRDNPNFNRRNKYNPKYENGSREEPEPEWFSNGPKSMTDFIDLKGFDDDQNNNQDDNENESQDSLENHKEDDRFDYPTEFSGSDGNFTLDSNLEGILKDFESISVDQYFGNSSRAQKWFKNFRKDSDESGDQSVTSANSSLMDLFQKKNVDFSQFSPLSHADLSKAVNVSELEANMLGNKQIPSAKNKPEPMVDTNAVVMSKLQFLANNPGNKQQSPEKSDSPFMPVLSMNPDVRRPSMSPHGSIPNEAAFASQNEIQNIMAMNSPKAFMAMKHQPRPHLPNMPMIPGHPGMNLGPGAQLPPEMAGHRIPPFNIKFNLSIPPMMMNHTGMGFTGHHPAGGGGAALPPQNTPLDQSMFGHRRPHFNMMPPNVPQAMPGNYMIPGQGIAPPQPKHFNLERRPNLPPSSLNDDSSMANKLLKNLKFTPTSVYRKLRDHEQNNKQQSQQKAVNQKTESILDRPIPNDEIGPGSMDNMKELFRQLNLNAGGDFVVPQPTSPTKPFNPVISAPMRTPIPASAGQDSRSGATAPAATVNPSDLLRAFQPVVNPNTGRIEYPPLPLQNALKVEDIEKL